MTEFVAFWYLCTGVFVWLALTGRDSDLVKGVQEGRYTPLVAVVVSVMAITLWPRLVLAMATGK